MKIGVYLRNMGPHASRENLRACARTADESPIDDLWVFDHLAIPPEDSEGSGGLYVEPLATLAFVAGVTERIRIGTGVLVLPYRPALLTAKWAASIQLLAGNRLMLGVGVGWMAAEFRALGVPRTQRGALTDEALEILHRCFAADEVEVNGQRFLFLPRPQRPSVFVGGSGAHAWRRAVHLADGWMPGNVDAQALEGPMRELRAVADEAGKPMPEVVVAGRIGSDEPRRASERLARLAELGVTRFAFNDRYSNADDFSRYAERIARVVSEA